MVNCMPEVQWMCIMDHSIVLMVQEHGNVEDYLILILKETASGVKETLTESCVYFLYFLV